MAEYTNKKLRNQVIYSVYVRNHTEEGTFQALEAELDRIKQVGADIIWLMPIHPVGVEKHKGSIGCIYSIKDYRAVNPAYGTKEDFIHLVDQIHANGMKCIIDVVYNHTSPDSWLAENHPEYFYQKPGGGFGNKTGDWGDVIDLDYSSTKKLWNYLIETLCMWAEIVDGFRCDVASMVPLAFWIQARAAVEKVCPGCIWLAESIEPGFLRDNRSRGVLSHSDCELYQAFDITYDYDVRDCFIDYLNGAISLETYVRFLNFQDCIYPDNYIKLRFLENHDQPRIQSLIREEQELRNWIAWQYFQKGTTLVYAGQEVENDHQPSLFDKDTVEWNTGKDIRAYLHKLYEIKKDEIFAEGAYSLAAEKDVLTASYRLGKEVIYGIFSLKKNGNNRSAAIPNGTYKELLSGSTVNVKKQTVPLSGDPLILKSINAAL